MDPLPGVMILVPILAPIAFALGIDPVHFAIVVIVNLTIGLITPPVGSLPFVGCFCGEAQGVAADPRNAALLHRAPHRADAFDLRAGAVDLAAACQRVLSRRWATKETSCWSAADMRMYMS